MQLNKNSTYFTRDPSDNPAFLAFFYVELLAMFSC